MYIQQLYTSCLSEAAYYIESNGEAAIIDPMRDIGEYLQIASERNASIKYIFETHFHADFVSGHTELSNVTGAPIIYGPCANPHFAALIAQDSEIFLLGKTTFHVLHTPGHTLESSCYLLKDENGKDYALFSGDTLFVGDVGRPDLAQNDSGMTTEQLAATLYESIQSKIMTLADDVILYPAHGPGSSCGSKKLGRHIYSTIGEQKQINYALKQQDKASFVKEITTGLATPPGYFSINAQINKKGIVTIDTIMKEALIPIPVANFKQLITQDDVVLLDTRNAKIFTQGFVPGAISIGLEGRFAEWAGSLLPFDKKIVLITEAGKEEECIVRLARVGFENVTGYLHGGFEAWQSAGEPIDMIVDVEPDELAMDMSFDDHAIVLDVRREEEFTGGHVKDAVNIPLAGMTDIINISSFNDEDNVYIHCASGFRSVIAASLLKRQGIHNLRNVLGGWNAIQILEDKIATEKSEIGLN